MQSDSKTRGDITNTPACGIKATWESIGLNSSCPSKQTKSTLMSNYLFSKGAQCEAATITGSPIMDQLQHWKQLGETLFPKVSIFDCTWWCSHSMPPSHPWQKCKIFNKRSSSKNEGLKTARTKSWLINCLNSDDDKAQCQHSHILCFGLVVHYYAWARYSPTAVKGNRS